MTPTGILFTYFLGLIFTVGGIVFLVGLDDNRLLFGIPYLALGLLMLAGGYAGHKRLKRRVTEAAALLEEERVEEERRAAAGGGEGPPPPASST